MKKKVSITVDPETLDKVKNAIKKGHFRNNSHAFEYSILRLLGDSYD